jgi:hypothetical protein
VRWRKIRGRLAALLVGYVIAELLLVPVFARAAMIRHLVFLPRSLSILAQSSKRGLVPRDYTLLLGDSFAEGQGDWADAGLARGGRPDYGSAHVIHERTGEDVVTFGAGGANSVRALVKTPLRRRIALRRFLVGEPARVLVYFYEGNDLDDNVLELCRQLEPCEEPDALDAARIDAYLASRALRQRLRGCLDLLCLPGIVSNTLEAGSTADEAEAGASAEGPVNVARLAGHETPLARRMNGPSLELTEAELELGLRVFERSLASCRALYPSAEMTVVYVPSPLACYDLVGAEVSIRTYLDRAPMVPAERVHERSREIRARVGAIAAAAGVGFVDPTDGLRALARETPIHGPRDCNHFNEQGYRRLAEEILAVRAAHAR